MTGVADRDLSHEGIDQKVHPRAGEQCKHAVDRLASGEKEEADDTSHSDDRDPKISVEVLLNIESVMATGHAFPDALFRVNRGVHSERNGILTARAHHALSNRGWWKGNFSIAKSALEYNFQHETFDFDALGRNLRCSSETHDRRYRPTGTCPAGTEQQHQSLHDGGHQDAGAAGNGTHTHCSACASSCAGRDLDGSGGPGACRNHVNAGYNNAA